MFETKKVSFSPESPPSSRYGNDCQDGAGLTRAAGFPGAIAMLELGYRLFLPIRPFLSRFFRQIEQLRYHGDGLKRR